VTRKLSKARLDELVEEATTDAYGDSEQAVGFYTMMENDLAIPFTTQVLGVEVTVERIDMTDADEIVAVCREAQNGSRSRSSICRCHRLRRKAPSGSRLTGIGAEDSPDNRGFPIT
jgi:hypothetical protein